MNGSSGRHAVVTQENIADLLGVSQKTVSLALSGGNSVSDELRIRIVSVAHRLGYQMRTSARLRVVSSPSPSRRFMLAMAEESDAGQCPHVLLSGLVQAADAQGLAISLASFPGARATEELLSRMGAEVIDGLLINFNIDVPPELPARLQVGRQPVVWLNLDLPTDAVHPDDAGAAALAVDRCLQMGHRRIAWIDHVDGRISRIHYSRGARRNGYRQAMRRAGLPTLEIPPEASPKEWISALLTNPHRRPSVMLCYGDEDAVLVFGCMRERGLRMPEDISLVCFANEPLTRPLDLSGPLLPLRRMAEVAIGRLAARIAGGGGDRRSAAIPCPWHHGVTLGPPP